MPMSPVSEVETQRSFAPAAQRWLRLLLWAVLVLLVPVAWFSMRHDPYGVDGDAVAYMDIADLIRTHQWAGVVNAYWHPLYPATLLVAQWLFHPLRANELYAYYRINFAIFLLETAAVLTFTTAVCRLRDSQSVSAKALNRNDESTGWTRAFLLPTDAVRLLGLALLVIASQRELTMGKVRPDALLQALLLFAFSGMLTLCRPTIHRFEQVRDVASGDAAQGIDFGISGRWRFAAAALMGVALAAAYLTKSFAFLVAFLSIAAVLLAQWLLRRPLSRVLALGAVTAVCFGCIAGPYVAALSHQKHRLDFGDSGSLNYAWYVADTEKMHLEPWQTGRFGSSTVHLLHPERQVMQSPGVYSYAALPYGTLPVWFDASYFNERIVTHLRAGQLLRRDARNVVLTFRYLLNHPEAWLLLALLLAMGARPSVTGARPGAAVAWRDRFARQSFLWLPLGLGVAMWCIYGLVNVEERYVTVAYLLIVLPAFAALRVPARGSVSANGNLRTHAPGWPAGTTAAVTAVALLCLLAMGESARIAAEQRRQQSIRGYALGWQTSPMFEVGAGLRAMSLPPNATIACAGTIACLNDPYWMRLAGVRTTTEIYMDHDHVAEAMAALPNRRQVYDALRAEGAPVLVGHFDPAVLLTSPLAAEGWQRLGRTGFYALPLQQPAPASTAMQEPRR